MADNRAVTSGESTKWRVRAAAPDDVEQVMQLAGLMYESMGIDLAEPGWRAAAQDAFSRRLGRDLMVVVVDDPTRRGVLAACGAGTTALRLPSPLNLGAQVGYLQWVSTRPHWRRRGLARTVTRALVDEFRTRGVGVIELHATAQAEGLYRSLGFSQGDGPGIRLALR